MASPSFFPSPGIWQACWRRGGICSAPRSGFFRALGGPGTGKPDPIQLAMRKLPRATYALMVSLLPAIATVTGIVVLAQIPGPADVAGVTLVVAGVALHRERTA